jgi:GT2 family glycosyltransferase
MLLSAFLRLPTVGFLAADLEDDPHDVAANYRYRIRPHEYARVEENGVRLLRGPTGGGCAMTSREIYDRVGGFREQKDLVFFTEDATYIEDLRAHGYEAAILRDLKVHHTGGPYYAPETKEKREYWARWNRRRARRAAIKALLFRLPLFGRANARFGWFTPPS